MPKQPPNDVEPVETALVDLYRNLNYVPWVASRLTMTRCDEIKRIVEQIEKRKGANRGAA